MNSQEFKRVLFTITIELENLLKHDLSNLNIDPEWSSINDAAQHVEFLKSQLQELSNSTQDKKK